MYSCQKWRGTSSNCDYILKKSHRIHIHGTYIYVPTNLPYKSSNCREKYHDHGSSENDIWNTQDCHGKKTQMVIWDRLNIHQHKELLNLAEWAMFLFTAISFRGGRKQQLMVSTCCYNPWKKSSSTRQESLKSYNHLEMFFAKIT